LADGFHLPSEEVILSKITPKTKAILFTNPGRQLFIAAFK
jgi:aspartate aminotransferase